MLFRSAVVRQSEFDEEERSFPIVLATETPVEVFDFRRGVVQETLRVDGIRTPEQVPLVDSHDTSSVRSVLGSIRNLEKTDGQLTGRAFFGSGPVSAQVFQNFADGHLTDFSVSARIIRQDDDEESGHRIIAESELIEGSAVVRGADPNAKAMASQRAYAEPHQMRDEVMFEELKAKLIERGLPEDADDADAIAFIVERLDGSESDDYGALLREIRDELSADRPLPPELQRQQKPDGTEPTAAQERQRLNAIDDICRRAGVTDEQRIAWRNDENMTPQQVMHNVALAELERRNTAATGAPLGPGQVEHGQSEREKFYNAARHGILSRALGSLDRVAKSDKPDVGEPAPGHEQFRYSRCVDIARQFVERSGERVGNVPAHDIIRQALSIREPFITRASDGPSFHTTGSFANLFLDAMHKTLRTAYDEAPSTYQTWVRQASSVADFKTIHRIQFGEIGLVDVVAENEEYPQQTSSDSRENYRVNKHGGIFSISMEMLVNDDLDAMVTIPRRQGNAMRRTINRDAYSVLIDNDALADGIALFHASSHGANLDATALAAGAPLDTGYQVMATQSGLDTTTVLGIRPRFLIVPMALSATALQITMDMFFPQTQATIALYGPSGPRTLQVVSDGQIDSLGSATNWWLAADPAEVDTVEITFLQGEESPTLDREDGFTTDTIKYKVRQTYALKAIDFRGLYQGNS